MKNIIPFLFGALITTMIFNFFPQPQPDPVFNLIENVDEMGDTPEEVYIGVGENLYMVETETLTTTKIY